jgi:hypothetical protein
MGLSRAFGCFQDPEARALKKQKKAGKRNRNEEVRPNRVIAATASGDQAEIEMRSLPDQSPLPANSTTRNFKLPPSAPGSDEPEPWSVGAVIRRTSLLQARLDEAANERKKTDEKVDIPASKARCQATVEEDVEMPAIETKPKVVAEKKEDRETSTEKITATTNTKGIGDGSGEGSGVRATMMFGIPTTKKELEVDLRAIEEEAEIRKVTEENNALAAKGAHKYSGAINWNPSYSQKATPMPLRGKDTKNSGWGWSGMSGSNGSAMDESYYDYGIGVSNGSAKPAAGSSPYGAPYGYGRRKSSHYAYVSGPAN